MSNRITSHNSVWRGEFRLTLLCLILLVAWHIFFLPSKMCNSYTVQCLSVEYILWDTVLPLLPSNARIYFFFEYHGSGFSSIPPFTRSLTNCFCLQGSMAALWCSNPFLLTKETDGRSRERGRWAATGCCEPDVSLPLSSALVQSALAAQAVVEHLWKWCLHNSLDC